MQPEAPSTNGSQPHTFDSFEAAREQAAAYMGFLASVTIKGIEIPNLSLLSDDQATRLAQLELDTESWDRHPDKLTPDAEKQLAESVAHVLEAVENADKLTAQIVDVFQDFVREYRGAIVTPGELKDPPRKNNELVESYSIQRAKAILGDSYEGFVRAGGRASDVDVTIWKMNKMMAERRLADSKSVRGAEAVEAVPQPNSGGS
jgi:hypothetical protein